MPTQSQSPAFNESKRDAFLSARGFAIEHSLLRDTSIRRYYRVKKGGGQSVIFMESVPDHSPLMSRGHKMVDFIRLSAWLNENGLKAPQVYDADPEQGYMLIEDFGEISFKAALEKSADAGALYRLAADVLEHLRGAAPPLVLPNYYDSHVHANHRYVMDYYAKQPDAADGYMAAWTEIEGTLPKPEQAFTHVDFHVENLMLLQGESGLKRCGILDFQGAMIGPKPYDLANLLEDARIDVPADLRESILARYSADFRAHYRILATQFHCRVIGQFIKIAHEQGNKSYLAHIPRLENYIRQALKDPLLKPLKVFFDDLGLDFSSPKAL